MKLIIDIPETMIQELKDGCFGIKHNVYELAGCIMNGIPLEDIKADIIRHSKICDPEFKDAFEVTVQIIDKHIEGRK